MSRDYDALELILEVQAATMVQINNLERKIMALLDGITEQVANATTVEQSAIKLINGLAAQIAASGTDPVKLQALQDQLKTNTDALAAAITQNTPAAPPA